VVDFPASGAETRGRDALSRRSLIAGAAGLAALAVTACSTSGSTADDATPAAPAELAPDVAVATRALAEIRAVRAAASGTLSRYPAVRSRLAALVQLHEAHEATLTDAVPDRARTSASPAPYAVPRRRDAALRSLTTREQRLHDTLQALALRAQSGDFARLLASMGAGISQQLAVWE
jgi:hypothetical protein